MITFIVVSNFVFSCYAEHDMLVYPIIVHERTSAGNMALVLHDRLTLNLERSTVLADKLVMVTSSQHERQVKTVDTSAIQKNLYHDKHHRSSLMVHQRDGIVKVEGIINHKLRIKPVPQSERSSRGHVLHRIYEVQETDDELAKIVPNDQVPLPNTATMSPSHVHSAGPLLPRRLLEEFVVEVTVISDQLHQVHYQNDDDLITYLAVMMNAVNLRYHGMHNPRIRFRLAGVTRSLVDVFASYISGGYLEAYGTIEGLVNYVRNGNIPEQTDVVYLITHRDMINGKSGQAPAEQRMTGLSYVGGVCTKEKIGMGEDIAQSYRGVFTMAHELGHTLGAQHDQVGHRECPWSAGSLMSYVDGGENRYRLTPCSKRQIRSVVSKLPEWCLMETSRRNYMVHPGTLPGNMISADVFCKLYLRRKTNSPQQYTKITREYSRKCKMQCCYVTGRLTWCYEVDILDGMPCGEGKTCLKGACRRQHPWF
ncbi:venom metalloproteinase antarease-like TtrivMP_A [Rhipicephalus sanguineus]|uniref:venom metalloproteinase antarease-like TtrivMP_A n=1 Tax=Rhipicephalus sanguineus TaxID=34632 RepID=UPI001894321D|nr:venom metalloproteinase antarease-like TtrivMP_A [Rhipicephalus sanguineus]